MPPQLSVSQWIALSEKYARSHAPEMASGKANANLFNLDVWHLGQSSRFRSVIMVYFYSDILFVY